MAENPNNILKKSVDLSITDLGDESLLLSHFNTSDELYGIYFRSGNKNYVVISASDSHQAIRDELVTKARVDLGKDQESGWFEFKHYQADNKWITSLGISGKTKDDFIDVYSYVSDVWNKVQNDRFSKGKTVLAASILNPFFRYRSDLSSFDLAGFLSGLDMEESNLLFRRDDRAIVFDSNTNRLASDIDHHVAARKLGFSNTDEFPFYGYRDVSSGTILVSRIRGKEALITDELLGKFAKSLFNKDEPLDTKIEVKRQVSSSAEIEEFLLQDLI